MTKILTSKTISKNSYTDVFYEKYWEPGFTKPLWRWGETIHHHDGKTTSYIRKTHLTCQPRIEKFS